MHRLPGRLQRSQGGGPRDTGPLRGVGTRNPGVGERAQQRGKLRRCAVLIQRSRGYGSRRAFSVSDIETIVKAVRANGIPVSYALYKDEGHGNRKKANVDFNTEAMMTFFDYYLFNPR